MVALPKPALDAVRETYATVPLPPEVGWPRISVVICAYNAEATIRECLDAALRLDYPDFEVVVVDDGSTDATGELVRGYPVRVISTENRGLSNARNTGAEAADGEVIAYLDSDAYPDPHWLRHLAHTFGTTGAVGVGGPNIPPRGDGAIAECVARSPGGPAHVLLSDTVAEHLPGCNLAVRAEALRAIGGFDPRFHAAGDDVDVCWRLQDAGGSLAFDPAAVVWHHRRNSIRAYWRQQRGYGRAEALLENKWPERYNAGGHYVWAGRIYDRGLTRHLFASQRIYHGLWGTAPFQRLYRQGPGTLASLPLTPEWLLLTGVVAGAALGAMFWLPSPVAAVLFLLAAVACSLVGLQASVSAARASFPEAPRGRRALLARRLLTAGLHVLQPLARLGGRLEGGLTLWRGHRLRGWRVPVARSGWTWDRRPIPPEERLRAIEGRLTAAGSRVRRGGSFDRWDLEIRDGPLGSARLLIAVEELGGGAQLVRHRCWPLFRRVTLASVAGLAAVSVAAAVDGATVAAVAAAVLGAVLTGLSLVESGAALGGLLAAAPAGVGDLTGEGARPPAPEGTSPTETAP